MQIHNQYQFVRTFAPATVANVSCAFDILGFPIYTLGDEVSVYRTEERGVVITHIEGGGGHLPLDAHKNTAGVAAHHVLNRIDAKHGVRIELKKNLPLGSGLGSSAASAAAACVAVNTLFGSPLSLKMLVQSAMEGERIACGSAHADNVAPSILGGFTLLRSYNPLDVIKLPTPPELCACIVIPEIELRTSDARKVLRRKLELSDAVIQFGNIAGLIAGVTLSDYELIGRSLHDTIIEPRRAPLIPGFYKAKEIALKAGVLGCSISGSGPSIFALSKSKDILEEAASKMTAVFKEFGISAKYIVSAINVEGTKILEAVE
jgi:homoserine kinase